MHWTSAAALHRLKLTDLRVELSQLSVEHELCCRETAALLFMWLLWASLSVYPLLPHPPSLPPSGMWWDDTRQRSSSAARQQQHNNMASFSLSARDRTTGTTIITAAAGEVNDEDNGRDDDAQTQHAVNSSVHRRKRGCSSAYLWVTVQNESWTLIREIRV